MKLGEICSQITDGKHGDCKDKPSSGFYFLSAKDVFERNLSYNGVREIEEDDFLETHRRTNLQAGDLLVTNSGTIGRVAIAKDDPKTSRTTFQKSVAILKPIRNIADSLFLYYALVYKRSQIQEIAGGTTQQNLLLKDIREFDILLPPLPEQRAIADVLGALDDKIELHRRMNTTLESMARAMFIQWFVHNKEARNWEVKKLSGICSSQYGYTASASDDPIGPKFLRITDMNKEPWIDWVDVPYCDISKNELDKYKLLIGDILVSRMADPGKAGIVEEEVNAVFASYLVRLKFKDLAWAYFGYYFLRSQSYLEYANGAKSGSVQSGMNAKVITDVDISVPPDEQIRSFFEAIKPIRNLIIANLKQSRTLASLRDSLLPKLMRGEVRVKDLEEE